MPITLTKPTPQSSPKGGIKLNATPVAGAPTLDQANQFSIKDKTSGVFSPKPSFYKKNISDPLGNFSVGAVKGGLRTVRGLGNIGGTIGKDTLGLFGIDVPNEYSDESLKTDEAKGGFMGKLFGDKTTTPKGTAENIGYGAEKVGEFFAPGGAEKDLYEKGAEHITQLPKILGMVDDAGKATKTGEALVKTLKVGLRGGITGGSTMGVTAAQGGDKDQIETAGKVGFFAGAGGQALETFGKGLSTSLQKAGFKLSPAQEAKVSAKADSAAKFMSDNKILGSDATKYEKLSKLNTNLEETLQASLPKDIAVPKQKIIDNINASVESLKETDPAIYKSAKHDADEAIALLKSQKGDPAFTKGGTISVKNALNAKRSYGSAAFKQTKFAVKDPRVVSEGSYAVEQGFQKALQDTLDKTDTKIKIPDSLKGYFGDKSEVSLGDFNKIYSNAISSKNLTNLARFKNDTGLVGRFFGLWAGESVGQVVAPGLLGKILGGAAGEIGSTKIPSMIRNVTERILSASPTKVTGTAKTGLGIFNSPR